MKWKECFIKDGKPRIYLLVLFGIFIIWCLMFFLNVFDGSFIASTPESCFKVKTITKKESYDSCQRYKKILANDEKARNPQLYCEGNLCLGVPAETEKPRWNHGLSDIQDQVACEQDDDVVIITDYFRNEEGCGAEVVIPNRIDGKDVIAIGRYAFGLDWSKKKDDAYLKLEKVVLPNKLVWVEEAAFGSNYITGDLKLPQSLRYIGSWGFGSNNISSVRFNSALEYIGENAFRNNDLTEFQMPKNVFYIGTKAFAENDIERVKLPLKMSEEVRMKPQLVFDKEVDIVYE